MRSPVIWFQGSQAKFLNTGKIVAQAGMDFFRQVFVDGTADETQLQVQGHSTQTNDILVVEKSDGTDLLQVTNVNGTKIRGTTTNDSAASGFVGEVVNGTVNQGSSVALTTATAVDIASIMLTAGDWDIHYGGNFLQSSGGTLVTTSLDMALSTISATLPSTTFFGETRWSSNGVFPGVNNMFITAPAYRASISATTTYYFVAQATFSGASMNASATLWARRAR